MLVESIATEPQPRCIRSGPRTRRTIRPDGSSDGSGCRSSSTVRTRADSPAARPAPTARQQRLDPSPFRIARPPLSSPPLQAEALNQPTLSTANSLSTEPNPDRLSHLMKNDHQAPAGRTPSARKNSLARCEPYLVFTTLYTKLNRTQ